MTQPANPGSTPTVCLVITGGVIVAIHERDFAYRWAEGAEGVVVELPIAADYRPATQAKT